MAASNLVAPGVAGYFLVFVAAAAGALAAAAAVSMVWVQWLMVAINRPDRSLKEGRSEGGARYRIL